VHAFPSLQAVPSSLFGFEQSPVAESHAPTLWHWSAAAHTTGSEPKHAPASHTSVCVQALPSLHSVPFGLAGLLHTPVAGLQVPASWHWSLDPHTIGLLPVHRPLWQVSFCVQWFPSLQAVPFGSGGFEQSPVAGSHAPAL
jgi:hypothetical protein